MPKGAVLYAFDGELNLLEIGGNRWQQRKFELRPTNAASGMYERRWQNDRIQWTDIPFQFDGNVTTIFYLYLPIKKTDRFRTYPIIGYDWQRDEWLSVKNREALLLAINNVDTTKQGDNTLAGCLGFIVFGIFGMTSLSLAFKWEPWVFPAYAVAVVAFYVLRSKDKVSKADREANDYLLLVEDIKDYLIAQKNAKMFQKSDGKL